MRTCLCMLRDKHMKSSCAMPSELLAQQLVRIFILYLLYSARRLALHILSMMLASYYAKSHSRQAFYSHDLSYRRPSAASCHERGKRTPVDFISRTTQMLSSSTSITPDSSKVVSATQTAGSCSSSQKSSIYSSKSNP